MGDSRAVVVTLHLSAYDYSTPNCSTRSNYMTTEYGLLRGPRDVYVVESKALPFLTSQCNVVVSLLSNKHLFAASAAAVRCD